MIIVDKYDDDIVNMSRTFGVGWGFSFPVNYYYYVSLCPKGHQFFLSKKKTKNIWDLLGFTVNNVSNIKTGIAATYFVFLPFHLGVIVVVVRFDIVNGEKWCNFVCIYLLSCFMTLCKTFLQFFQPGQWRGL